MNQQQKEFWEIINAFQKNNILNHVILIGSWAEYIYEHSGYLNNFKSNLKTTDIDFLIKNIKSSKNNIDLIQILEKYDFVMDQDTVTGITKFYHKGSFELQFLARELGQGQSKPYKVESFGGIKVEGLRPLNFIFDHSINIKVKDFSIAVPSPQSYLLHKMMINSSRKNKKEKDSLAIENILDSIKLSEDNYGKLKSLYNTLTSKQKKDIDSYCKKNLIELFDK